MLQNELVPASIHVSAGRITAITAFEEIPDGCEIVEAGEASVVMPGLVDTHVHVNEPGRTEWEGFATATRAAAARRLPRARRRRVRRRRALRR